MSSEPLSLRFTKVWVWFLPAWILPFYFLCLKIIAQLVGLKLALSGLILWLFATGVAVKAKRSLNWGEFYLFYVGVPLAALWLGFCAVMLWVKLRG